MARPKGTRDTPPLVRAEIVKLHEDPDYHGRWTAIAREIALRFPKNYPHDTPPDPRTVKDIALEGEDPEGPWVFPATAESVDAVDTAVVLEALASPDGSTLPPEMRRRLFERRILSRGVARWLAWLRRAYPEIPVADAMLAARAMRAAERAEVGWGAAHQVVALTPWRDGGARLGALYYDAFLEARLSDEDRFVETCYGAAEWFPRLSLTDALGAWGAQWQKYVDDMVAAVENAAEEGSDA